MSKRRRLLFAGCGAAALGACGFSLEYGLSNPCFDFVLKRHLRAGNKSFSKSVFETRQFFAT